MDKQQEIKLLEELAVKLGANSYTGEWFHEQLPFMKTAIQSDLMAGIRCVTFRDATARGNQIVEEAKQRSEHLVQVAHEQSAKIVAEARKEAANINQRAISAIRAILKELES